MGAYWINPKGKILDLKGSRHIDIIVDNPNKFGESKQSLQKIYDKYGENFGIEGKARNEIISRIMRRGFVRIREYKNRWSVQVWKISNKINDVLWVWAKTILPNVRDKFADVDITEIGGNKGLMRTSLSKMASGASISEESKDRALRYIRFVDSIDDFDDYHPEINENKEEKYLISESSLSRLWRHNEEHDCAFITAFRDSQDCGNGPRYTKKEKLQRNASLKAKLKAKRYGVTKVLGKFVEGGKTVKEDTFFVVDVDDTGLVEKDMRNLGKIFEQDSVLIAPKGSFSGNSKEKPYYVGTNNCPNNSLQMGAKFYFDKAKLGKAGPNYGTFIKNRPFIFEDITDVKYLSMSSVMIGDVVSKKPWKDIDVDVLK